MRNFTITSVWGIPIRVNVSLVVFLPVLAWLIGSGGQIEVYAGFIGDLTGVQFELSALRAGLTPWVIGVLAAVGLFVSVTLHELGHSWVALRYGLSIESITLWILGGIASLTSIPREWNREFWIAIAGPITSVLVGAGCYVSLLILPESLPVLRFVFGWLAITNIILAVFNLLPAFPMDGGRILRALLARHRPYASATRLAGRIGVIFALIFAVIGVMSFNVILILLALFIYGAATTESRTVLLDEMLTGYTVDDIMTRDFPTTSAYTSLADLSERMIRERQTSYAVTDDTGEIVGLVGLIDLKGTKRADADTKKVLNVMRQVPSFESTDDAFDTLAVLNQSGSDDAFVVENGLITGMLTQADYAQALMIQKSYRTGITG